MNADLRGEPFCCNPDCVLHVRSGDAGVQGTGNWAQLPDGTLIGRGVYHGLYLCDPCGRSWHAVIAVKLNSAGDAS
jgi:hypothetical protein